MHHQYVVIEYQQLYCRCLLIIRKIYQVKTVNYHAGTGLQPVPPSVLPIGPA
jgi:hypothetical protein